MPPVRSTMVIAALALSATLAAQDVGLTGVVGLWRSVDDGGPALQIDGASWSGTTDPAAAKTVLADIGSAGIDMLAVTDQLTLEGVKLFADSYDQLIANLERKRKHLRPVA